jgi:protein-tyrosine-phosphatase
VAEEVAEPVAEVVSEPAVEGVAEASQETGEVTPESVETPQEVTEVKAEVAEVAGAESVVMEAEKGMVQSEGVSEEPGIEPGTMEEGDDVTALDEEAVAEDYKALTQIELLNLLREVVDGGAEAPAHNAEVIIAVYYRKMREVSDEHKRKFLTDGGDPAEYVAVEDPYGEEVKELARKYRQQRFEQGRKLDAEKEVNLQKKYEIIEEIKSLLNKEESINRTFQEFRELQKKWYEIGQVPQAKMKDLWDTYHFHVENFYDYIKINKELRDLDLKKNLEAKMEICEKAEELLVEPSVIKAFNALQKLHEEWRETGPVPADKKDDIWERFKAATSKINLKHQEYFEKRKLDQKKNMDAKVALCEKAEEISEAQPETHRDWDEKSRELVELQKVWKTIGFAPKRDNNKVYERFRNACDKFFVNKREFYSRNKDIQQVNLQMKIDLCMEAETLKDSTDWKKATQQFIDIQKRWKEVGPIPRKSSDAVWKRFRAACDYFFERKALHFSDIDGEQGENLKLKEALIAEVEGFQPGDDPGESLRMLRDFQRRWTEIGHVPIRNKETIQHRFRDAINKQFDDLKIDNSNRTTFNFRSKIESMTDNARGLSKVRSEREKYMIKLKQLETDLTLLDNNIGFFANSKNAQALIADVNQKIQDTREKIEQLKEKIRIIDDLDKSEY